MPIFRASALAEWTGGHWHRDQLPDTVVGFAFDARKLVAGDCFVALSGGARDGHDFCAQAEASGASALLVESVQAIELPQLVVSDSLDAMAQIAKAVRAEFGGPVVGVTGSCGKTSTKEMLRWILGVSKTHATAGNWNNRIGVPMTLYGLASEKQDFAVIEAGINQPGEMVELGAMIQADLCVVTMIGAAHLELLGSLDAVAFEKSALMAAAKPNAPLVTTNKVLNYAAFAPYAERAVVLVPKSLDWSGSVAKVVNYELTDLGSGMTELRLAFGQGIERFQIRSASEGICVNAALAITAGLQLGVGVAEVKAGIEAWEPSGNRGKILTTAAQTLYVDCYNANPSSMADALNAFVTHMDASLPRCYVLGAMNELGDAAAELHRETARQLKVREQDAVCLIGPKFLTEAYTEGALAAGVSSDQVHTAENCETLKSLIADFSGAIFLKGSRSYGLESFVPETLR